MLESLIIQNESKTLEFKENTKSLPSIIKAVIAFANTAGGNIVIGICDKTKSIVGVENPLQEEERLASSIADSIEPLVIPDIQILSFRNKELLVIQVPHMVGPFYLKSTGLEHGTYVRVGSTNRMADSATILSLQILAKNISFDELPCIGTTLENINHEIIQNRLSPTFGEITQKQYESLGIVTRQQDKAYPTNAGILLFSHMRFKWFPDASIACVCFADKSHEEIVDQQEIKLPLIMAHEEALAFIRRNTKTGAKFHESTREDIFQYPPKAIREALINAIVHADYSMKGCQIQVAIFSDRIEITSPGGLPYGQTLELALSGVSRMRNRAMGRLFREINLIERLGTGLKRIMSVYQKTKAKPPLFQELNTHFRVTLYSVETLAVNLTFWETALLDNLAHRNELGTTEIAKLWGVTTRTARTRLKKMTETNLIHRVALSHKDPHAVFKLGTSERPIYTPSFVAFLDILGFKNHFIKNKNNDRNVLFQLLSNFIKNSGDGFHKKYNSSEEIKPFVTAFSDSVAISTAVNLQDNNDTVKQLHTMLHATSYFSYEALSKEYLVRASISFGEVFHKDNIILGESFMEAVEYEKKSFYPRIILTPNFIYSFKLFVEQQSFGWSYEKALKKFSFKKDDDGALFFDWLNYYISYPEDGREKERGQQLVEMVRKIHLKISLNLEEHENDPSNEINLEIAKKLLWAKRYLDNFLKNQ